MNQPRPTHVRRVSPHRTDIVWDDGHVSSYPSWYLREHCPCALCVDEVTGERLITPGCIASDLERIRVEPVGNYALKFTWSDEHDTGIYTFDFLRSICPCAQCLPQGLKEPLQDNPDKGLFEA